MAGYKTLFRALAAAVLIGVALGGCGQNAAPDDHADAALGKHIPRLLPAAEVLAGANIPTLDPHTMAGAEIEKVIGPPPYCLFRYTSSGNPILGFRNDAAEGEGSAGVVKLDGDLVALEVVAAERAIRLAAEPVRLSLAAEEEAAFVAPGQRNATLIFEIGEEMRVGYRGYFACIEARRSSE